MAILVVFLLQLWNQPSVRMVGIGRYFEGFISDPITDLNWNPAALKNFGNKYGTTFDALQLYTMVQKIDDIDSIAYPDIRKNIFLRTTEPLAFFILCPKIGLGFRTGAFIRSEQRNYSNIEQWLYGQNGFYGALNIGKYVKIGGEFNWSWNNRPDEYEVTVWDSLYNEYDATIFHSELSKEFGAGCIISNNRTWQISTSVRKSWENNTYKGHRFWWPDSEKEKGGRS